MDWDWHLIVEVATLIVAVIAVILLLVEEDVRRHRQGLPTMALPAVASPATRRAVRSRSKPATTAPPHLHVSW